MNIEAVRAFVAVAEEGQFQLAADRLDVSQQAVSKRIAALEAELGTALFKRTPSGAALTQDGRTFLPHAGAILAAVSAAVASVQPGTRPLRVDVLSRGSGPVDLLRDFCADNPGVAVEMVIGGGAASTFKSPAGGRDRCRLRLPQGREARARPGARADLRVPRAWSGNRRRAAPARHGTRGAGGRTRPLPCLGARHRRRQRVGDVLPGLRGRVRPGHRSHWLRGRQRVGLRCHRGVPLAHDVGRRAQPGRLAGRPRPCPPPHRRPGAALPLVARLARRHRARGREAPGQSRQADVRAAIRRHRGLATTAGPRRPPVIPNDCGLSRSG